MQSSGGGGDADLEAYFRECRFLVDSALEKALPQKSAFPSRLHEAMRYSLLAKGKRIRPILCMAASEACGGGRQEVLPVACAIEMIHAFSLIHDDLPAMDDDNLRRGVPTNHRVFGEALALLAGDALLSQAFIILGRLKNYVHNPVRVLEIIHDIAESTGSMGMVGGQTIDMESEGKSLDIASLKQLHRMKTGKLIAVSVTSGAKMITRDVGIISSLESYGEALGLAFQIADDILDIEGDETLGKDLGSDVENSKATYPSVIGLDSAKKEAKALCRDAISALDKFGAEADFLRATATYIVERGR